MSEVSLDAVALAAALIRRPSITPKDEGALTPTERAALVELRLFLVARGLTVLACVKVDGAMKVSVRSLGLTVVAASADFSNSTM